jgi:hypothetical protein
MKKMGGFLLGAGAFASALVIGVAGGVSEARASDAPISMMTDAEKLERLDIMLLVTSLRCRSGEDDYQAEYTRFQTNHRQELTGANRQMHAVLMKRLGNVGAERELDRLNVEMANNYGNGHPTLGCHDLKIVTQSLADAAGAADLLAAAAQLLDTSPAAAPTQMVTAAPTASAPTQLVYELAPAAGQSVDASAPAAPPTQLVYNLVPAAPSPVQAVTASAPAPAAVQMVATSAP